MPKSQNDPRSKYGFPRRLSGDSVIHQFEKPFRVVVRLNVNVEMDVLIFRLKLREGRVEVTRRCFKKRLRIRTFMRNSIV
jgi:hypothetical protein